MAEKAETEKAEAEAREKNAALAVKDSELLEALLHAAVYQIWEFTPQELANTAWASGMLAVEDSLPQTEELMLWVILLQLL